MKVDWNELPRHQRISYQLVQVLYRVFLVLIYFYELDQNADPYNHHSFSYNRLIKAAS